VWEVDTVMPITDVTVRGAKGSGKPYKLADGGGLYLWVRLPRLREYLEAVRFLPMVHHRDA